MANPHSREFRSRFMVFFCEILMIMYVKFDWKTPPTSGTMQTPCLQSAKYVKIEMQNFEDLYVREDGELQKYAPTTVLEQMEVMNAAAPAAAPARVHPEQVQGVSYLGIIIEGDEMMMRGTAGRKRWNWWRWWQVEDTSQTKTATWPHGTTNRRRNRGTFGKGLPKNRPSTTRMHGNREIEKDSPRR